MYTINERTVGIKNLVNLLIRKIQYIFLSMFLAIFLCLILYPIVFSPQYTATGNFVINKTLSRELQINAVELVQTSTIADLAIDNLQDKGITVINGKTLDKEYILSGIKAYETAYSQTITVTFTSPNEIHNEDVVNSVIDVTVNYGNSNRPIFANSLVTGDYAEKSEYTGTSREIAIALSAISGVVIGSVLVLILSLTKGVFLFESDFAALGLPYGKYGVDGSKGKTDIDQGTRLINELDSCFSNKKIQTIGFISTDSAFDMSDYVIEVAKSNIALSEKVLIMNFDCTGRLMDKLSVDNTNHSLKKKSENELFTLYEVNSKLVYFSMNSSLTPLKEFKSLDFSLFIKNAKLEYDHIIVLFGDKTLDFTYLLLLDYLDVLNIGVLIEKTKIRQFYFLLNNIRSKNFTEIYICNKQEQRHLLSFLNKRNKG